jgi:nitrogen regulatory protein PII
MAEKNITSPMTAPRKLKLLFTVVNRSKAEFYVDLLQNFEVNMQTVLSANGTASTETLRYLGLTDSDKSVILSVIREDRVKDALSALEEKFKTVKNGKGIAYTVPMTSTIGVAIYQFLSNTSR